MRWKVDAIIETRFPGPDDEAQAKKLVQAEIWRLVEALETALGTSLSTNVVILGIEPAPDDD
jgi:hypothetical protein